MNIKNMLKVFVKKTKICQYECFGAQDAPIENCSPKCKKYQACRKETFQKLQRIADQDPLNPANEFN